MGPHRNESFWNVNIGDCFASYFKGTAVVSSHAGGFCQESLSSSPVISLCDTFPTLVYFKFLFVFVTGFEKCDDFSG